MEKKIRDTIDGFLDKVVIFILVICFLVGGYGVIDTLSVYQKAQDKSSLKYKPSEGETLHTEITDNVAWLTIDDSTIDYAIMQGDTNETYLNADVYGKSSLSGSIFLDYRNDSEFTDDYNLVYGHHMEKGLMFGSLDDWYDEDYFNSHTTGTLTTKNRIYKLALYVAIETDASVTQLFQPTDTNITDTVSYLEEHALFKRDVDTSHLVALSTCRYPDTDERTMTVWSMELVYEGNDTDMDQTKTEEISDADVQVGTKVFKNIEPRESNPTILDTILSFVGL